MADPQVLPPLPPPLAPPASNDNSGPTTSTPQGQVSLPTPPPSDVPAWANTAQNAATIPGVPGVTPTLSADVSVQQPPPPGQDTASGGGTKPDGSDVPKDQRAVDPTKVPAPQPQQPPYNGPPPVDPFSIGEHPEFKQHYDQMQKDLEQARAATEEANRRLIEMYKQGEFQTQRYREVMNEALENERTMTQLQNRIAMHPPTRSTNDQQVAAAGMATALASIGGRLANPTSMLTAMGAASNAAVDRNDELFKQNMEVWKTQADLVGHGAELESKLQSDAVSAAGNNSKMLLDQLTPLAQVTQNTSLLHKLENGDYESAIKQVQDYRKLAEDFPIHQVVAQAGMTAWHQIQSEEAQWSKDHDNQPVPDEVKQQIEQKAIAGYNRTVAPLQAGAEKPSYSNWEVPDPEKPGQTKTVSARPDPSGTGLIGVDGTSYPTGTKVPETQAGNVFKGAPEQLEVQWPNGSREVLTGWSARDGSGDFHTEQGDVRNLKGAKILHVTTNYTSQKAAEGDVKPTTIDFWSKVIANGGALPPYLARTAQGAVIARAIVEKMPEMGMTPQQLIANQGQVKANQASLNNMTKMADAATNFENTAIANFKRAMQLAPDAIPTDFGPLLNNWIENGEIGIGNVPVPAYVTALLTAANEYAKVMSGSTGAQASTVDARREAAQMFSPGMSHDQIEGVVGVAINEMENRKNALYGQVGEIRNRMSGQSPQPGAPGTVTGKPGEPAGSTGGTRYQVGQIIEAGGKRYRVTGGDLNGDPEVELVPGQ